MKDLARLLAEADYEMDADEITAQMTGEEEVDPTFPGFLPSSYGSTIRRYRSSPAMSSMGK